MGAHTETQGSAWIFDLSGGQLCLNFANTVSGRGSPSETDRLSTYADLVSWARQVGIATHERSRQLLSRSERHPRTAIAVLEEARDLREAILRIFIAIASRERPVRTDLEVLNRQLAKALQHQRIVLANGGWVLSWEDMDSLDSVLWPVVKSAVEILTSESVSRVRVCEAIQSKECYWLFFDDTRNSSRRWCSMRDCGNRAKARRHYHRVRKGKAHDSGSPSR